MCEERERRRGVQALMSPGCAVATVLLAVLAGACASVPERPHAPLPDLASASAGEPGENWPLPPEELARRLEREVFEIRASEHAGAGVTGARKMTLFFPDRGEELVVKWKPVPRGSCDGWNNSPRKELAVYAIQQWFLDPQDYVVPTTVARCLPLDVYRRVDPEATPNLEGTRCVLGVMAAWLENVTVPDRFFEPSRFFDDANYAYHMANFNLLTYLVEHEDGRRGNFLVARDGGNRRVFAVDNGISFGSLVHNFFVKNWNRIRVPALRRESVERLRAIRRSDIDRLGVLIEMKAEADGILRPVPPGANADPSRGARVSPGAVQLGLTRSERDALEQRIRKLLEQVDRGEIPTASSRFPRRFRS